VAQGSLVRGDTPYHSGKHKRHGMNIQVLTDPLGRLLWTSPALPRSTHDLTAARTLQSDPGPLEVTDGHACSR
jgi:hypothetical protein